MMVFASVLSLVVIFAIRGIAANDGAFLDATINAFMQGDYSAFEPGGYLNIYPFQIGYVLFGQFLYLIGGASPFLLYQLLNLVSILFTLYFLYQIAWELFRSEAVCDITVFLSVLATFLYVYTTLVYNDIWSLAPQFAAMYLEIRYLKYNKRSSMIGAITCIAVACLLKTNCMIALIAMVLTLVLDAIRRMDTRKRDWGKEFFVRLLWAVIALVVTFGVSAGVKKAYAKAAGLERLPGGVPATAYILMGMEEVEDAGVTKYGWYNGTNAGVLNEAGSNSARASEIAKERLKQRWDYLSSNPKSVVAFYGMKFVQQWGDPTCASIREMEMSARHVKGQPPLADSLQFGRASWLLQWMMNVDHTLIYFGFVIYFMIILKNKKKEGIDTCQAFLVMFIFGGMLFHEMWEASSRYVMRYYLTMLPMAAYGIDQLITMKLPKEVKL